MFSNTASTRNGPVVFSGPPSVSSFYYPGAKGLQILTRWLPRFPHVHLVTILCAVQLRLKLELELEPGLVRASERSVLAFE